jgi:hypothetical protein
MSTLLEPRVGWLQLVLMAIGLLLAYEVCYRIGRRRRDDTRDVRKSQTDVAVGALLALLGLLLAFSFSIGAQRFEQRRQLVLDEANAIVTAYLRCDLAGPPYHDRIQELLRQYVRVRLAAKTSAELERVIKESAALHEELWANTAAVGQANLHSPAIALFIDAVNRMINLREARVTVGLFQRIPPAIFVSLYVVSLLALGMVGLRAGLDRTRGPLPAMILIGAIICVMALIASLDDPESRLFHISRHALEDAQRVMTDHATAAAEPER